MLGYELFDEEDAAAHAAQAERNQAMRERLRAFATAPRAPGPSHISSLFSIAGQMLPPSES